MYFCRTQVSLTFVSLHWKAHISSWAFTCDFFWERNKNHSPNSHLTIQNPSISLWNPFHCVIFHLHLCGTLFWTERILNHCDFTDVVWEMKNFKFSDVSLVSKFLFLSQKKSSVHKYCMKIVLSSWNNYLKVKEYISLAFLM